MSRAKKMTFYSLRISVTEKEHQELKDGYANSTCRSISEYVRKRMFSRKITVCYRNRAFDEFIEEAIRLRKALILFSDQGRFDEHEKMNLLQKIEEISLIVIKISETCSQM